MRRLPLDRWEGGPGRGGSRVIAARRPEGAGDEAADPGEDRGHQAMADLDERPRPRRLDAADPDPLVRGRRAILVVDLVLAAVGLQDARGVVGPGVAPLHADPFAHAPQ